MLPDYNTLLNVMKQAGLGAAQAQKPVNVCFGKVTNSSPLKILVEQKIMLNKMQLILTKRVSDEALQNGEEVILLRMQGGQKYVVIDRVV